MGHRVNHRFVVIASAWIVGIALLASAPSALAADAKPTQRGFSARVMAYVAKGEHREAIAETGEYEVELLSRAEPPKYEKGLFQGHLQHVSFKVPWDAWAPAKFDDPRTLEMAGIEMLLALKDAGDERGLVVMSINWRRLVKKMGIGVADERLSDQMMQQLATMIAGKLGNVKAQEFRKVGQRSALYQELAQAPLAPSLKAYHLREGGRLYTFVLRVPASEMKEQEQKLIQMLEAISFDYKPENQQAVTGILANRNAADVRSSAEAVEALASAGEFDRAVDVLAELRLLIAGMRPRAAVRDNVGTSPLYGITMKNPDPARWNMQASSEGIADMIIMEDRTAVGTEAIMVMSLDFQLAYGPGFLKLIAGGDERSRKDFLVSAGRGAAATQGEAQDERIVQLKGSMAYEAVVNVAAVRGLKCRLQLIMKEDYGVMVMVMADQRNFDAKLAEADKIVEANLTIKK
jgi:hypothetical protein